MTQKEDNMQKMIKQQDDILNNMIRNVFKNELAFLKIKQEITLLKDLNEKNYKVIVMHRDKHLQIKIQVLLQEIQKLDEYFTQDYQSFEFTILINENYPETHPNVLVTQDFCTPSLNDGRNILDSVVSYADRNYIPLLQIVQNLPQFIIKIFQNYQNVDYIQQLGQLKIGQYLYQSQIEKMKTVKQYNVQEYLQVDQTQSRTILITQSYFMTLINVQKNQYELVNWAYLQSLIYIKKKNENKDDKLQLYWRTEKENGMIQILKTSKYLEIIKDLVQQIRQLGINANHKTQSESFLSISDVNQNYDINKILEQIKQQEMKAIDQDLNKEQRLSLISLYQQAVEYYSACDQSEYTVYLQKIKNIQTQLEDIQEEDENSKFI